jgi:hypothetical protein
MAIGMILAILAWTPSAEAAPSCGFAVFRGNAGDIYVKVDLGVASWGITMHQMSESIGRWDVDTFGDSRKLTSGFHRTTTTPYVPHGSIQLGLDGAKIKTGGMIRPGATFQVKAKLVSATGRTYISISNACTMPESQ